MFIQKEVGKIQVHHCSLKCKIKCVNYLNGIINHYIWKMIFTNRFTLVTVKRWKLRTFLVKRKKKLWIFEIFKTTYDKSCWYIFKPTLKKYKILTNINQH